MHCGDRCSLLHPAAAGAGTSTAHSALLSQGFCFPSGFHRQTVRSDVFLVLLARSLALTVTDTHCGEAVMARQAPGRLLGFQKRRRGPLAPWQVFPYSVGRNAVL